MQNETNTADIQLLVNKHLKELEMRKKPKGCLHSLFRWLGIGALTLDDIDFPKNEYDSECRDWVFQPGKELLVMGKTITTDPHFKKVFDGGFIASVFSNGGYCLSGCYKNSQEGEDYRDMENEVFRVKEMLISLLNSNIHN